MTLEEMHRAVEALSQALYRPIGECFAAVGLDAEHLQETQRSLADGQFYVLLNIKTAESNLLRAYEKLDERTEYLKDELEKQLEGIAVLLLKMEKEEHLRRDRAVLVSAGSE